MAIGKLQLQDAVTAAQFRSGLPRTGGVQGCGAHRGVRVMSNQNLQDGFLNNARRERVPVTIYLTSGVKLSGRVKGFDKYCVVFETNHQEQLIFKHAISTVVTPKQHGSGHGPGHSAAESAGSHRSPGPAPARVPVEAEAPAPAAPAAPAGPATPAAPATHATPALPPSEPS